MSIRETLLRARTRAHSQKVDGPAGRWADADGSILDLKTEGHEITGTIAHRLEKEGHQIVNICGRADGALVCFLAHHPNFGALAAWTGAVLGDRQDRLCLRWSVIAAISDAGKDAEPWIYQQAGKQDFHRIGAGHAS